MSIISVFIVVMKNYHMIWLYVFNFFLKIPYIHAGDELVFKCPTWSWECASEPSKLRSILPPDKQFLITRNVPCRERIQTMRNKVGEMTELLEDTNLMESSTLDGAVPQQSNEEGWLLSHIINKPKDDDDDDDDEDGFEVVNDHEDDEGGENLNNKLTLASSKTIQDQQNSNTSPSATPHEYHHQQKYEVDDDDEYADLEDDTMDHDETTATAAVNSTTEFNAATKRSNIQRVRTYDISITYDKYYQTPKVWILGYSTEGTPLSTEQMFQDIMPEYVQRTVTIESHPSVGTTQLSIHPCQHAAVMKTILRNLNQAPKVEFYLFIFLKFISSIIPTINYDFTLDVTTNNTSSSSSKNITT